MNGKTFDNVEDQRAQIIKKHGELARYLTNTAKLIKEDDIWEQFEADENGIKPEPIFHEGQWIKKRCQALNMSLIANPNPDLPALKVVIELDKFRQEL